MSYYDTQLKINIGLRDSLIGDPGRGLFFDIPREFVLMRPELNLMEGIREEAEKYFNDNGIPFWNTGAKRPKGVNKPTGHMLSSQVACINHLLFFQHHQDIATAILKGIDNNVKTALRLDNDKPDHGFVSLEVIGKEPHYLNERNHSRGANATSIDAAMLAEMNDGTRKIFFIEWKYVEEYKGDKSKFIEEGGDKRKATYLPLLQREDCPIIVSKLNDTFIEGIFYEPFYQLMRQTLLAHEMTKAKDFGATDYIHLHLIPTNNKELKLENTSKGILKGATLEETWKNLLKSPAKYKAIGPKDFLEPARHIPNAATAIKYLEQRYWN
ncbi:MAG: hypothetical protein V1781_00455 [Bacteroidota bacterium]